MGYNNIRTAQRNSMEFFCTLPMFVNNSNTNTDNDDGTFWEFKEKACLASAYVYVSVTKGRVIKIEIR